MSERFIPMDKEMPNLEVYFDCDFLCRAKNKSAGWEQPINAYFNCDGKQWYIPSVYVCNEGLVLDYCIRLPSEELRTFSEKHRTLMANKDSDSVQGELLQLYSQSPMSIVATPEITLNGQKLVSNYGRATGWNPYLEESHTFESRFVLEHYDLDPDSGWLVWRYCFECAELIESEVESEISSLSVTFKHNRKEIYGPHFKVSMPGSGDRFTFTHPTTGEEHTLTVQRYDHKVMPVEGFPDKSFEYPAHHIQMYYTIYPNLPDASFCINDFCVGDKARKKAGSLEDGTISVGHCLGMIKNSEAQDIAFGGSEQGRLRATFSAMRFEPVDSVEWQIIFFLNPCDDTTVELI